MNYQKREKKQCQNEQNLYLHEQWRQNKEYDITDLCENNGMN